MRYSLLAGGKHIRPILCIAAYELVGCPESVATAAAYAVEIVLILIRMFLGVNTHNVTIHDNIPCMDDDDLRRSRPMNHKVFGEGIAVLAGDSFMAYAFAHMAIESRDAFADKILRAIMELTRASGAEGMVGGQVADLQCQSASDIRIEDLEFIHVHKTAAILEVAVVMGAVLGGGSAEEVEKIRQMCWIVVPGKGHSSL
ncbi:hypothetical protein LguiA_024512 [Lonicera macranthoides]